MLLIFSIASQYNRGTRHGTLNRNEENFLSGTIAHFMTESTNHPHHIEKCVPTILLSDCQQTVNRDSITCHEDEIPDFADRELERLYGTLFSSLPYLDLQGKLTADTSTYVVRNNGKITTVILFRRLKRNVKVINKGMCLTSEELQNFCNFIFARYDLVQAIVLDSVEVKIDHFQFPYQRLNCPSEIMLDLPASPQEYLASLGTSTRKNIKRRMARLSSDYPSFNMAFYEGNMVVKSHLETIIFLNKTRMEQLKKIYVRESKEVQKITDLCRMYGLVGVVSIDGLICGGNIGYLVGTTYTSHIGSHDSKYDQYSLGMLTIYLTICECIVRGCRRFNFMSGNNPYKSSFGGVARSLGRISIYRSRMHFFINPKIAFSMIYGRWIYRSRLWVQLKLAALQKLNSDGELDFSSKTIFFILDRLRTLKDRVSSLTKRN